VPSEREIRKQIDSMVAMLAELANTPYEVQRAGLDVLRTASATMRAIGNPGLVETMTGMTDLPPDKLRESLGLLRGQLLVIKRDQFGG
jgi:hypothetical protein